MAALSSDTAAASTFGSSFGSSQGIDQVPTNPEVEQGTAENGSPTALESQEQAIVRIDSPLAVPDNSPDGKTSNVEASQPTITPLKANISFQSSESFDGSFSQGLSQSMPSTLGYLSNRWNAASSFSTPATLQAPAFMTPAR